MNDDLPEPDQGVVRRGGAPNVAGPSPSVEAPSLLESNASDTDMDLSTDLAREPSVAPPGPVPDRYLGCTIDNRYKVEGIVGEGGMGVVYQCRHKIIDKRVALKILRADLARDAEVTERFLMEAKAASAIQDEHIISISDFGQLPDGAAYFVMEFLEGTPLALLAGGGVPMPLTRIIRIALQLSEGLAAAHQLGIVHRDLKPDNVFLIQRGKETDFVKILDFGIAKVSTSAGGRLTQVGSVFGTPHYMSPEQAAGTPLDHRGDIYSLGVMLYELATGRVPFDAENFVGILSQQLYQDPVPPRAAAPDANIPAAFETIILKCMAKKPERRYQSMQELRDDLLKLQVSIGGSTPRDSVETGRAFGPSAGAVAMAVDGTALSTELTLASLRPRRWRMYVGIAAPVAMVVAALFWQLGGHGSAPRSTLPADLVARFTGTGTAAATRAPAPPPAPTKPQASDVPASPTQVLLGVAPATAHVFMGGRDLGESPVSIEVREGSLAFVEVRHPDYETRQLELDGSEPKVSIELKSKSKKRSKSRAKGKRVGAVSASIQERVLASKPGVRNAPADNKSAGGQLFVEPWQKP